MNKKCSNAMEYQSIGFHYVPDGDCKCFMNGEPRKPCERLCFEPGSSRIRLIQIPFKDMSSLIPYLILVRTRFEPGSKRSNAMEYISLMVSTTPPSGIVIGFEPYSTYSNSIQISLDTVFDTGRIQFEPGSKRSNAME